MTIEAIDLSRLQFAYTIFIHFLFVPLTIGLAFIMAIMETIYVRTSNEIYKQMVQFWSILFAINFAMGVVTGVPMEFQFGTNWSYYSHYVGDIFGVPLAVEGLMAFFLEATFVGLFFYGWDKLSAKKHLMVTWLVFIGSNFSALWILIANGWMQNPVGSYFNVDTMRMEMANFSALIFNPVAQLKFLHTLTASYILGAVFVIAVSSYYILTNRNIEFAKRSIMIATIVGLMSTLVAAMSGHEKGLIIDVSQKAKIAAFEGVWNTEKEAGFRVIAWPNQSEKRNKFEIVIPKLLTIINGTPITGTNEIIKTNEKRIKKGIEVYKKLLLYKKDTSNIEAKKYIQEHIEYLGYALLLYKVTNDIPRATESDITSAANLSVPNTFPLFYSFRIMVALGLLFLAYFVTYYYVMLKNKLLHYRWLGIVSLLMLPLPWVAIHAGWFSAEYGRQPWVIQNILPTFKGASAVPIASISFSLVSFFIIYTTLLVIDIVLMVKQVKKGPDKKAINE